MEIGGYHGTIIRVDLTHSVISKEKLDINVARKFLGGSGFGAWVLLHEVPPNISWDSPENRIVFAVGPLNGSTIPGTGAFAVVSKGPMTNLAGLGQTNGYFGACLKLCGYDAINNKKCTRFLNQGFQCLTGEHTAAPRACLNSPNPLKEPDAEW